MMRRGGSRRGLGPLGLALALTSASGLALWVGGTGCKRGPRIDGQLIPATDRAYGPGESGLREFFADVLRAGQRDERDKMHDLFASTIMADEDLEALFGKRADFVKPRYKAMIGRVVNAGAIDLVAQIGERKYDDVEVVTMTPQMGREQAALLAALPPGTPVYSVRVKRKADRLGLRYDGYLHRGGRWMTANQLGKILVEQPDLAQLVPLVRDGGLGGMGGVGGTAPPLGTTTPDAGSPVLVPPSPDMTTPLVPVPGNPTGTPPPAPGAPGGIIH